MSSKNINDTGATNADLPLIIVNPKSAGGATRDRWSQLAAEMRSHFGPFSVAFTKAHGDGITLSRKFADAGRKFILACGGDGTINEVVNGIMQSGKDVEMGIVPAGTGGDFRKTIDLSTTARDAARQLREGRSEMIDLGRVSFKDKNGQNTSRYFINVASFGLSASINNRVKEKGSFGWIPNEIIRGKTKFAISTIQEILDNEFLTIRVAMDGNEEQTLNTINFCVCNGRYFGGGMKIAPDAKLADGKFDVVNIGDINTAKIMINGYKLYNGTHLDLSEVKAKRAQKIVVSPSNKDQLIDFEADGELPGCLPATFEIVPKALKLRVPSNS